MRDKSHWRCTFVAIAVLVAACSPAPSPQAPSAGPPASTGTVATQTGATGASPGATGALPGASPVATTSPATLHVATLHLALPRGVSRAVAFADGETVLLAGGLTSAGTIATVLRIDPAAGVITADGALAKAVHDAGGALVGGAAVVFGGGNVAPESMVQRYDAGHGTVIGQLPQVRADLVAVEVSGVTFILGGGTPAKLDASVLSTTDGAHFSAVTNLLDPARYPAVGVVDGSIIVVGGTDGTHDLRTIQAIDPTTGIVRRLGELQHGLSHAAALVIDGHLLVAGGRTGGVAQDTIWEVDPSSGSVHAVGHLPKPVSDMASAVVGNEGYLFGGETSNYVASIVSITFG